jgi:erythronolide synthase
MRRLSDARKADNQIYAKLHGSSQLSGIAPDSSEALEETLRRALHRALRRIPNGFRDIDYWEMHASGIPQEDAAEEALLKRFTVNRGAHIPLLALGSAKTSFGHTMTASGALGLLKGILAVRHRVLPPSITPLDDSFRLKMPDEAYYWVQEARPWIASSMRPRRLAVSTISHTGNSGAAILEEVTDEH